MIGWALGYMPRHMQWAWAALRADMTCTCISGNFAAHRYARLILAIC